MLRPVCHVLAPVIVWLRSPGGGTGGNVYHLKLHLVGAGTYKCATQPTVLKHCKEMKAGTSPWLASTDMTH